MKHGEARINQRHPLRTQDAVVISELRAASAEHKGDLIGPEIRVNPDAELAAAPPARVHQKVGGRAVGVV